MLFKHLIVVFSTILMVSFLSVYSQTTNQLKDALATSTSDSLYTASPLFQNILSYYKKALESYVKGDYATAAVYSQKALLLDPMQEESFYLLRQSKAKLGILEMENTKKENLTNDSIELKKLFQRGMFYYINNDLLNAKKRWELLKAIDSKFLDVQKYIDVVNKELDKKAKLENNSQIAEYYFKKAFSIYSEGNKLKARSYLDSALQMNPDYIEALTFNSRIGYELENELQNIISRGKAFYTAGEYTSAIKEWKNGLNAVGNDSLLQSWILEAEKQISELRKLILDEAQLQLSKNNIAGAMQEYESALTLMPDDTFLLRTVNTFRAKFQSNLDITFQNAIKKFNEKDYKKAAELFTEVLKIAPQNKAAQGYLNRSNEKMTRDSTEKLIATYKTNAKRLEKDNNLSEALQYWYQINDMDTSDTESNIEINRLLQVIQEKRSAATVDILYSRSIAFYKNGKYTEAKALWDSILVQEPENKMIKNILSEVDQKRQKLMQAADQFINQGKWDQAIGSLTNAIKITPGNQNLVEKLRIAEKKYQDEQDSIKVSQSAAKKNSNQEEINELFNKGLDYYMSKDYKKALELWNKILVIDPENFRAKTYVNNLESKLKKLNQL